MKINDRFCLLFKENIPYLSRGRGKEYQITELPYLQLVLAVLEGRNWQELTREYSKEAQVLENFGVVVPDDYEDDCCLDTLSQLYFAASRESIQLEGKTREEIFKSGIEATIRNKKGRPFPFRSTEHIRSVIGLPTPRKTQLDMSLFEAFCRRKTFRVFEEGCTVSLQSLANLLFVCFGPFHGYETDLPKNIFRRTCPMNGGLRSTNAYVLAYHVKDLEPGIYFYEKHELGLIGDNIPYSELQTIMHGQEFGENCAFGIVLATDFRVQTWKYPTSRNVKVVLIDIGCLVQTIQLVATSDNLQTWISGAMSSDAMEDLLKIESNGEAALFFVGVGKSSQTYDMNFINKCYKDMDLTPAYNKPHIPSIIT